MGRFFEILMTILLSTALVLGGAFALAKLEGKNEPIPQETAAEESTEAATTAAVETTLAAETEPAVTETKPQQLPEKKTVDAVPRYYQTDYPNIKFGNGTISSSGCSITCLAMVSTYLTDHAFLPDQMAYAFASYGKNNIERLEYGNAQMQLPNTRTENVQDVLQALREGKVVIAMMDDESIFTTTQHFIVLAGMTEDGKILVNDPLRQTHPEDVYMKNGYAEGFGSHDIIRGFSGAWIYDKAAMPEEPFLLEIEEPEQEENRYDGYILTDEDVYTLACFAWVEARKEPEHVQQAIIEVILNRVVSEDYPNTVWDVLKKGEYYDRVEKMKTAKTDYPQYRAVYAAMYGPYQVPKDVYYFSIWETQGEVWGKLGSFTFLHSRKK